MHPHRILSLLFLLLLSLALGACASHDARPAPEPGAPLPAVTLERGDRVFIKIENGKSMTEDLHSMLTAYLQSERGLNPASDVKEADLVILVEIRDVWATSDGSRVSAGRTLGNVGTGTMLGVLLGVAIAVVLWWSGFVSRVAEPYLVVLNSLPKSALAPLLIVWLGANQKTIIVAGISVAIFGSIINLYTGFHEIDKDKMKLIATLGGTKLDTLLKVVLPSSIPLILSVMKVNIGLCLVGVII